MRGNLTQMGGGDQKSGEKSPATARELKFLRWQIGLGG